MSNQQGSHVETPAFSLVGASALPHIFIFSEVNPSRVPLPQRKEVPVLWGNRISGDLKTEPADNFLNAAAGSFRAANPGPVSWHRRFRLLSGFALLR